MTPKEKLAKAVGEPKGAPKALVESMVSTANAIETGRSAEKRLKEFLENAPPISFKDLVALAAVGRLAQNHLLPAGTDATQLADQMKELPAFDALANRSPQEIQHDLETGRFTDDLTRATENKIGDVELEAEATPTLDEPEIDAPEKQAPLM